MNFFIATHKIETLIVENEHDLGNPRISYENALKGEEMEI